MAEPDFSGWATKNDILCTDNTVIKRDAFMHQDQVRVPLVWQHQHNDPTNILGHVILHNRSEGVWVDGYLNATEKAGIAKELLIHGDLNALSIFATRVQKKARDVIHGFIGEVSLVLGGANAGALIEHVRIVHGIDDYTDIDDEMVIKTNIVLEHSIKDVTMPTGTESKDKLQSIIDSMSDEQQLAVAGLIQHALEMGDAPADTTQTADTTTTDAAASTTTQHSDDPVTADDTLEHNDKAGSSMTRNVFDSQAGTAGGNTNNIIKHDGTALTHGELQDFVKAVGADVISGSATLQHAMVAHASDYGITNVELLFPDAQTIEDRPEWITRKMEWVEKIFAGTSKRPWSRIKSMSADLTHEQARAKGYIKGNMKKDQFFALAKRETGPCTVYKKQKFDRDDVIDVTKFDIIAWMWIEMKFMLREEIARAILLGDGREVDDEDKIDEGKIRPIAYDDEFYTYVVAVPANISESGLIKAVLRARPAYKGTGNPTAFMREDVLTDMLLDEDKLGRRKYDTLQALSAALRVDEVVPVPIMEDYARDGGDILMVIVNLSDYTIGSDKGGEITTFDQFDIDFNQLKYLIEGRLSGALMKHRRAQVVVRGAGAEATPTMPGFTASSGALVIPTVTGVSYERVIIDGDNSPLSGTVTIPDGNSWEVQAVAASGYYFPHLIDTDWTFTADE